MRLTLRTLLAYLDDILEPAQTREIGSKIEENPVAQTLTQRIREVLRRRRLMAPDLDGPGIGIDPNLVAEYLDNTLTPDSVADVERVCLESDVQLAEVAACHQVLTLVLGEPVSVLPRSRERMYALGPEPGDVLEGQAERPLHPMLQPASRKPEPSPQASPVPHPAPATHIDEKDSREFSRRAAQAAVAVISGNQVEPAEAEHAPAAPPAVPASRRGFADSIPEHLRPLPVWRRMLPWTVVLVVAGVWVALLVREPGLALFGPDDDQPAGNQIAAVDPAAEADGVLADGSDDRVAAVDHSNGAAGVVPPNDRITDTGLPPMPQDPPPPPDVPEDSLPATPQTPVVQSSPPVDPRLPAVPPAAGLPGTTPAPGAPAPGAPAVVTAPPAAGTNPPGEPVAAVTTPAVPPKAGGPAAEAGPIKPAPRMEYLSKDGILLLFNPMEEEQSWNFLRQRALIRSGDTLASPVPFDGRLQVSLARTPLAEVVLRGGTLAQILPPAGKSAFGLDIRQGRILINSQQSLPAAGDAGFAAEEGMAPALALQIHIGGRDWLLTLEDPGTVCGLEVAIAQPAGYRKRPESTWFGRLVVRSGGASLRSMADAQAPARKVTAGSQLLLVDHLNLNSEANLLEQITPVPQWLDPTLDDVQTEGSRKYASARSHLQRKLEGAERLSLSLPQIAQDRNAGASELAVLCLALTERYPDLVDVLAQSDHPESRRAAVEGIRNWLVTDPDSPEQLPAALSTRFFPEVSAPLERLLWSISEADARNPDLSRQILDMLSNDNSVIRELAFREITRLTGVTYLFNPLTPPAQQRTSLQKWDKHLQKNGGALLPADR
ncbi:MAG: hypothetical protein KDA79_16885 [Planctomycetaceae bacterium]|nr:hypothetical protein [Planctomycetaceae bacterium]